MSGVQWVIISQVYRSRRAQEVSLASRCGDLCLFTAARRSVSLLRTEESPPDTGQKRKTVLFTQNM